MTERLETENSYEDQVRRGRELSCAVVDALAEYGALPSEVRVELAWRAIAHYHTAAAAWGESGIPRSASVKELRVSYLTEEEQATAIKQANDWLDEHLSE